MPWTLNQIIVKYVRIHSWIWSFFHFRNSEQKSYKSWGPKWSKNLYIIKDLKIEASCWTKNQIWAATLFVGKLDCAYQNSSMPISAEKKCWRFNQTRSKSNIDQNQHILNEAFLWPIPYLAQYGTYRVIHGKVS